MRDENRKMGKNLRVPVVYNLVFPVVQNNRIKAPVGERDGYVSGSRLKIRKYVTVAS